MQSTHPIMQSAKIFEYARAGDAEAIATLLSRTLSAQGISVRASVEHRHLHLILRSVQIPDQKTVAPLIQRGLKWLGSPTIESVSLQAQQFGDSRTVWEYRFHLALDAIPAGYQQPDAESLVRVHIQPQANDTPVVIGDRSLHLSPHGAVVRLRQEPPLYPSRRQRPTAERYCAPFSALLDRHPEVQESLSALRVGLPVEFHGEQGLGKSVLLRYLAHLPQLKAQFPDGIVYQRVQDQPLEDLAQFLFDAFYEYNTPLPTKPTDDELYDALLPLQALAVLDEVELDTVAIATLIHHEEPGLALLLATTGDPRWSEGRTIPMRGLPIPDAVELVEQQIGQVLYDEERTQAETLCRLLKGHPLRIIQTVAAARADVEARPQVQVSTWLQALIQKLQAGETPEALTIRAATTLPEIERRLLAVLAVFGATPVAASHLKALTAAANLDFSFQILKDRGLVWTDGVRYRLAGNVVYLFQHIWDLSPWIERSLNYFKDWAQQHDTPVALTPALDVLWRLTCIAAEESRWETVLELSMLLDQPLCLNRRWGRWRQVWSLGLEAARSIGDGAAEAYALHQLGTRALGVDDVFSACTYLSEAVQIRTQLSDTIGAAVSQHNLNLLLPAAPAAVSAGSPTAATSSLQSAAPSSPQRSPQTVLQSASPTVQDTRRADRQTAAQQSNLPQTAQSSQRPPQPAAAAASAQSMQPPTTKLESDSLGADARAPMSPPAQQRGLTPRPQSQVAKPHSDVPDEEIYARRSPQTRKRPAYVWVGVSLVAAIAGGIGAFFALDWNNAPFHISQTSIQFPPQLLKVESAPREFTVTNEGSEAIDISSVVFSQGDRLDFSLEEDCTDAALFPGDDCTVSVSFAPREAGSRSTRLRIADATGRYVRTLAVRGVGARAEIGFNPDGLTFEPTLAGQSSQAIQTVSLTNESSVAFTMGEASLTGAGASGFAIARNGCAGQPLDPGDSCTVDVAFDPPGAGDFQANLAIADATGEYMWASALAGTGQLSAPGISPARIAFGQAVIGSRASQTVTLTNTGSAPLEVQNLRLDDATRTFSVRGDSCTRNPVQPGESCRITLGFNPQAERSYSANLIITDNAVRSPRQVAISGQGSRVAAPSLTPNPLVFGELEVNSQRQESLTLTNRGSTSLRVRDVSLGSTEDFSLVNDGCEGQTLASGASCQIGIRFSPSAVGDRSTTLTISDSATGSPRTVTISGTGVSIPTPEILSFEASPREVNAGEQSNLCYRVSNTSQLSLRNDITGSISRLDPTSACVPVTPDQTTTYTLIARGRTGENVNRQIRVRVAEPDTTPPATPAAIAPAGNEYVLCNGGSVALRWNPVSDNSDAVSYVVVLQSGGSTVDGSNTQSWTQVTRQTVESTSLEVGQLLSPGRISYRWQVSARDAAGNESAPSGWLYFRTCADVQPYNR